MRAADRFVQRVNTVAQIYLQWLAFMLVTRFKLTTQPEFEVSGVPGEVNLKVFSEAICHSTSSLVHHQIFSLLF